MAIIIIAIFMIRIVILLMPSLETNIINGWQKIINTLRKQKPTGLFDEYFIEAKNFYLKEFNTMPCIAYIGNVNTSDIFSVIQSGQFGKVTATYQRNYFNWQQEQIEFSKTLFRIEGKMMVKLGDDWLEILFSNKDYDRANKMLHTFKTMKAPQKEDDYEINIQSHDDEKKMAPKGSLILNPFL